MARTRRWVPMWSIVVAAMAALVWAVVVPIAVALLHDYSVWSHSEPGDALPMPSWLIEDDAHEPLAGDIRVTPPFVRRVERQATATWRGGTYDVYYEEVQFGWPFKSLSMSLVGARHLTGTPPTTSLEYVNFLHDRIGWRAGIVVGRGAGGWPTVIPVVPKWGLLANAVLVALPIVIAATVWRAFVHRRRLAEGRCPMCGYEEAAKLGSCAECGWGTSEDARA